RVLSFPEGKPKSQTGAGVYMKCKGKEIWSDYWLFRYQALQIGRAPFYIQGNPQLPGEPLCTIGCISPSFHEPYPWVNHPEPLFSEDERRGSIPGLLELGDTGCVYISIDDDGQLSCCQDCF